jgi:hypothetical protein
LLPSGSVRGRPQRTEYPVNLLSLRSCPPAMRPRTCRHSVSEHTGGRAAAPLYRRHEVVVQLSVSGQTSVLEILPRAAEVRGSAPPDVPCQQAREGLGQRYFTAICSVTSIPRLRRCSTNGRAGTWVSTPPAPRGISPRVIISATMAALQPVQRSIAVKPVSWSK